MRKVAAPDPALIGHNDQGKAGVGQLDESFDDSFDRADLRGIGTIVHLMDQGAVPVKKNSGTLSRHDFRNWREVLPE